MNKLLLSYYLTLPTLADKSGGFIDQNELMDLSNPVIETFYTICFWLAIVGAPFALGAELARYIFSDKKDEVKKEIITQSVIIVVAAFCLINLKAIIKVIFGKFWS